MAAPSMVLLGFTLFWLGIAIVPPFFFRRSQNYATIRVCFIEVAVCCYMFWLFTYLSQ
eukprot:Ihof_evm12s1 gene=Ihof_evmTU12s1